MSDVMKMAVSIHSHGDIRCRVTTTADGGTTWATLNTGGILDGITIYLTTPAEISAFRFLAACLAVQDTPKGNKMKEAA